MKKILFTLLAFFSISAYADADWLSPAGMTKVMEGVDDSTFHVSLGHTFPYYGGIFTDAWMSSNGVIILYDPTTQFGNPNIYNSMCCSGYDLTNWQPWQGSQFSFMLAPLWTDLRDANLTPTDGYYYETGQGGSSFLWYNVTEYATSNLNTFQANLWPDGSFDFLYDEVDVTQHSVFMGFTGDMTRNEINQLGYYQSGVTEFDIDFHSQSVNGGRAWYGQDGGYKTTLDCSNVLNDPQCPGYEQAYYEQQCSYDALYDIGCQGYEQAYFDYQCTMDDLYDPQCPGYQGALAAQDAAGTDFIFGDDISDFYDTEPEPIIEETNMFLSSGNETDMFASYEEETNMFTEPESYEEPIEETFFEESVEEAFFDEPTTAAAEEEIYEETVAEEDEYIEEQITHIEEDMGNIEEELPISEVAVQESIVEREILAQESVAESEIVVQESAAVSTSAPSINAVSIALNTAATTESSAIQTSQQQSTESAISVTETINSLSSVTDFTQSQTAASEQISIQAELLQEFNMSASIQQATETSVSESQESEDKSQNSESYTSFGSLDSAFENATFNTLLDPSMVIAEVSVAVESPVEQATQEEPTVDFQMESSTPTTDSGFSAQQDQSFSTGQSITAVLNNVAPNFSQFDVAPPSQQEQQTTQKADAQANNMSEEQLASNLEEFANDMKDSGGFGDQSLTVFLMGRNSNFAQYNNVQLRDNPFYNDRGLPANRVQNDRNSMLQLIGTSGKHEEMISGQYR